MLTDAQLAAASWNSYDCENCICEDYYFICGLCALLRPQTILEVGTEFGLGAASLYTGSRGYVLREGELVLQTPRVTTVDTTLDMVAIRRTLEACDVPEKSVEFVLGDSRDVLPDFVKSGRRFDLTFLDGCHDSPVVQEDWSNVSRLSEFIVLHDSTQKPAVRDLVAGLLADDEWEVLQLNAYPFGSWHNVPDGPPLSKMSIAGMTLVRRRSSYGVKKEPQELGLPEASYLKEVGYCDSHCHRGSK
jgi:hypothetical protein